MNDVFKTQLTTDMFNRMLGMNNLVSVLNNISYEDNKYPPHNVYKDGDNYVVEIALAGWEEDDISVIVENLELTIKGEKQDSDRTARHMAYKGISTKNFSKKFVLAPHYVVPDATFKNGLLTSEVKHFLPEELKPREIKIST